MNAPNYLIQRNNQTVVSLRPLYEQAGFAPKHFSEWMKQRLERTSFAEGKDFETFMHNRHTQYVVPVPVAMTILDTLPNTRTKFAKQLLYNSIQTLPERPAESANEAEGEPAPALTPTALPEPEKAVTFISDGPVEVMVIEGRGAVRASDLVALWKEDNTYLKGWMNYRIGKLNLVIGRDYVEFTEEPLPGKKKPTIDYILTLNAAAAIARSETKGKGIEAATYLQKIQDSLSGHRKGKLSDFIGARPATDQGSLFDAVAEADRTGPEPVTSAVTGQADNCNPVTIDAIKPEPFTVSNAEEDMTIVPLGPDAEPQVHRTPTAEELGHEEQADENPDPQPSTNGIRFNKNGQPYIETKPYGEAGPTIDEPFVEVPPAPPVPSLATLLLESAQMLVQMAQLHVEHERKIAETSTTVGQMVAIGQQAALGTLGLSGNASEIPEQTKRSRIQEIVNSRCRVTGETQDQVYGFIYNRLFYLYRVNVNGHRRIKGESYLELCERIGQLDNVYAIVTSAEFQVAIKNAPMQPKEAA